MCVFGCFNGFAIYFHDLLKYLSRKWSKYFQLSGVGTKSACDGYAHKRQKSCSEIGMVMLSS